MNKIKISLIIVLVFVIFLSLVVSMKRSVTILPMSGKEDMENIIQDLEHDPELANKMF